MRKVASVVCWGLAVLFGFWTLFSLQVIVRRFVGADPVCRSVLTENYCDPAVLVPSLLIPALCAGACWLLWRFALRLWRDAKKD